MKNEKKMDKIFDGNLFTRENNNLYDITDISV